MPREIWALGFVSLFMDVSSEMIHGLLPVFLITALGSSYATVGLIEGLGEGIALAAKVFSGPLSDFLGRRKALVVLGYALGALSKPLFAIASSASWVLGARMSDRIGKGVRGAPRDALIADLVPANLRGRAYGLRQSLDTVGAFLGPLIAMGLMAVSGNNFRLVFWLAVIPGLIAVGLLIFGVREPQTAKSPQGKRLNWRDLSRLGRPFWLVVGVGALFQFARFSEAFLILRGRDMGLSLAASPLVLISMNVVYALAAYPVGHLADHMKREHVALVGILLLVVADLVLAKSSSLGLVFFGIAVWGLHLGFTQGVLAAMVADTCPAELRGSAFGFFNLFSALVLFLSSPLAGWLWDKKGAPATFYVGAGAAAISALTLWRVQGVVGAGEK